jgi:hypothetical protein
MKTSNTFRRGSAVVVAGVLLVAGCVGEQRQPAEETTDETVAAMPATLVYVNHPVADVDAWLAAYDNHEPVRAGHNLSEMWIHEDLDNEGLVHILFGAGDVDAAKHFLAMEDLPVVMQEAGVTGDPTVFMMDLDVTTAPESFPESQYNVLVAHEVADWAVWKAAFDADKPAQDAAGLVSRGIARDLDNPNMLYINFAANDLAAARALMTSEELKSRMLGAGVVGEPIMFFTETVRVSQPSTN